jgi:hypothetical protein
MCDRASADALICSMSSIKPWIQPEIQADLDAMGARIRHLRLAADATQRELEELAWLDQSSISRVERGLMPRLPMYKYARLLAAAEGRLGRIRKRPRRQRSRPDPWWG